MSTTGTTLTRFLLMQQQAHPGATGEFSVLLSQIAFAAKKIAYELGRAGLVGILGDTGENNIQGEVVQKLDAFANDAFLETFAYGQQVSELAIE